MAAAELDFVDDDPQEGEEEVGLSDRQVSALEKLADLGAEPRADGEKYDSRPQIRALQMVYEGKLGGPGRGQGRKRTPRVSAFVAAKLREEGRARKIVGALDEALDDENNRIKLDAVKVAIDIEHKEALVALKEDEFDREEEEMDRKALIEGLIAAFANPQVDEALKTHDIDLPDSAVTEIPIDSNDDNGSGSNNGTGSRAESVGSRPRDPAGTRKARSDTREPSGDAGRGTPRALPKGENPWKKAARRRAADTR